eukprot:370344_1
MDALSSYSYILFIWIISIMNASSDPPLDCNYVSFPTYLVRDINNTWSYNGTLQFALPIGVCGTEWTSSHYSYKIVCDNNKLFVSIWWHANTCDDSIQPSYITTVSSDDYKCDATAACDYAEGENYPLQGASCTDGVAPSDIVPIVKPFITDTCFSLSDPIDMSVFVSGCDSSDNIIYSYYGEQGCNGSLSRVVTYPSPGICDGTEFFIQNTACPIVQMTTTTTIITTTPAIMTTSGDDSNSDDSDSMEDMFYAVAINGEELLEEKDKNTEDGVDYTV